MSKHNISTMYTGITVGIDLSDKSAKLCRLDAEGKVAERRTLDNTREAYRKYFAELEHCRVVIEVGTHSPWISRLLSELGHEVVIANPRQVALIYLNNKKTDKRDAELLARLGRFDVSLLNPITHRGAQAQADLATLRSRAVLVKARTELICHVRGTVKTVGGFLKGCDADYFHRHAPEQIPDELRGALTPVINQIAGLSQEIKQLKQNAERMCKERYPETAALRQVTGVGLLTSLCFILVIDDASRFKRSREVAPFLGLTPGNRESGESDPQMRITKAGDVMLRSLLVQCAQYMLGHYGPECDLRRWGLKLQAEDPRRGKKRAIVAVARKLSVLLHRLWVTGEVYDPDRKANAESAAAA